MKNNDKVTGAVDFAGKVRTVDRIWQNTCFTAS